MAIWGQDIQQVRNLANQLNQKAGEIEQILGMLSNALHGTIGSQWVGPDATQFGNEWDGSHVPALRNVIQGLRDASNKATANANAQEQVSNTV